MRAPLVEVGDPWRHTVRVKAEPKHVHGRLEQVCGNALDQALDPAVRGA